MVYSKEFMNRINKDLDNKIKATFRFSPMFIFIINSHTKKEKDDKEA